MQERTLRLRNPGRGLRRVSPRDEGWPVQGPRQPVEAPADLH